MISNSLYKKSFSLDSINAGELTFGPCHICDNLELNNSVFTNLNFKNTFIGNTFELFTIKANNFDLFNSTVERSFEVYSSTFQDITLTDNKFNNKTFLSYSKANDIKFKDNELFNTIHINGFQVHDFNFENNKVFERSESQAGSDIKDDEIEGGNELIIWDLFANNAKFIGNYFYITAAIHKAEINNIRFAGNEFLEETDLYWVEADQLDFEDNKTMGLVCKGGIYTNIEISHNEYIGKLSFNNIEAGKNLILTNNSIYEDFSLLYCKINNNLEIYECTSKGNFKIYDCTQGNNILLNSNTFLQNFSLQNNVIHGSTLLFKDKVDKDVSFLNNHIRGDLKWQDVTFCSSLHVENNNIEVLFHVVNLKFGSRGPEYIPIEKRDNTRQMHFIPEMEIITFAPPKILKNSFNSVSFEKSTFSTAIYFDNNTVLRNLSWGRKDSSDGRHGLKFPHPVSFSDNKIRTVTFNNLTFSSAICMQNNHIESGFTLYNTQFVETMDLSGSFIGGSCTFSKINADDEDGDLVLDNAYIDKRIRFIKTKPRSFSFINANFSNFEIPSDWRMRPSNLIRLRDKNDNDPKRRRLEQKAAYKKKKYIFKETAIKKQIVENNKLPYSLIKTYCDSIKLLERISSKWRTLHEEIMPIHSDTINNEITGGYLLLKHRELISECIGKYFTPVYYGFIKPEDLDELHLLSYLFINYESHNYNDAAEPELIQHLSSFFDDFDDAMSFFLHKEITLENGKDIKSDATFKNAINSGLQEQYQVLRHIYGSNGELNNEDRAYYKWMHYCNNSDISSGSFRAKLLGTGKKWLFEKTFGWGVNLWRIVLSTFGMVVLFASIYKLIFAFNPLLKIKWDEGYIYGKDIDIWWSGVLALQTTFSAVLGDWAPIGSGIIKVPMTINAILGILFVTFLIGAYGRKMLR